MERPRAGIASRLRVGTAGVPRRRSIAMAWRRPVVFMERLSRWVLVRVEIALLPSIRRRRSGRTPQALRPANHCRSPLPRAHSVGDRVRGRPSCTPSHVRCPAGTFQCPQCPTVIARHDRPISRWLFRRTKRSVLHALTRKECPHAARSVRCRHDSACLPRQSQAVHRSTLACRSRCADYSDRARAAARNRPPAIAARVRGIFRFATTAPGAATAGNTEGREDGSAGES